MRLLARRLGSATFLVLALLLVVSRPAGAGDGEHDYSAPDDTADSGDGDRNAKKKNKKSDDDKKSKVTVGGRVFTRATVGRSYAPFTDDPYVDNVGVDSARIEADYRRGKALKTIVEVDFADGDADLKDGYIRYRPNRWFGIKAGRFKRPISAIALESAWRLPTVERGLLSEVEFAPTAASTQLAFGGRAKGVELEYRHRSSDWKPRVVVGVFENDIKDAASFAPIDVSKDFPLDVYGRVTAEPIDNIEVGASFTLNTQRRNAGQADVAHSAAYSFDVVAKVSRLKVWVEAFGGASPVYTATGATDDGFVAARGTVALRVDDLATWLTRLEPYVAASFLDPLTSSQDNESSQLAGGINAKFHKDLRIQLEIERTWIDDFAIYGRDGSLIVYLQLGATF